MASPTATTVGLCECGCGQQTKLADRNYHTRGYAKGQPLRFVHGHAGAHFQAGEANIRWMGDNACRDAIHKWVSKLRPLTGVCEECGATGCRTEYSNIDHKWRRDPADYRELCSRCHRYYDYRELGIRNPCLEQMPGP